jgi:hypothetical protein
MRCGGPVSAARERERDLGCERARPWPTRGEAVAGMVAHRIAVIAADELRALRLRTGPSLARFVKRFGLDPRFVRN